MRSDTELRKPNLEARLDLTMPQNPNNYFLFGRIDEFIFQNLLVQDLSFSSLLLWMGKNY